jgi:uncharacterized protein with FMN-binding domain
MKKILIVIGFFIGFIGIAVGVMATTLSANMKTIRTIPLNQIDVEALSDGTYMGKYYFENQIGATVDVTIEDGLITNIKIVEHIYGKGAVAEVIIDDIIQEQTLYVDDIAGATTSSHVLKLAIQNALEVQE